MIRLKRLYAHDFKQLHELDVHFPDVARILVQGKNEAGKSTLFEAVFFALFGQALLTEGGARDLDDLIRYDQEKARVELDLTIRDRLFKITRTLIRGKANKWELVIVRPDGTEEEIRSNKAVNDRIRQELGFDADAMLNTCFVEQKKLDKLEGSTRAKREEALTSLLNLERLSKIESDLRLRGEDEKHLLRLTHRVELARAQGELPGITAELERAEAQLHRLDLRHQLESALTAFAAVQVAQASLAQLGTRRTELQDAVTRVDALDRARQSLDASLIRVDALQQDDEQFRALTAERAALVKIVDEHLPALEQRQFEIRRLGRQAARLTSVDVVRGNATVELQRAANLQTELDTQLERGKGLNETITAYEMRLAALDEKLRGYEIGDALGEWATAFSATISTGDGATALATKQRERAALNASLRRSLIYLGAIAIGVVVLGLLVVPALLFTTGNITFVILVALFLAAFATFGIYYLITRLIRTNRQVSLLTEEIGKLEGIQSAQEPFQAAARAQTDAAATKLTALNIPIPASVEDAQARRITLAATLENKTRAELTAERGEVQEKLTYARVQREETVKRIQEMTPANAPPTAELERKRAKADKLLGKWQPRLARRAAQFNLPPETQALREAYLATQIETKNLQDRARSADKLAADAARIETRIAKTRAEIESQYIQATTLLNGATPAQPPTLDRAAFETVRAQLDTAYEAAGGDAVRADANRLEKHYGGLENESKMNKAAALSAIAAARLIEGKLNINDGLSADPNPAELTEMVGRLDAPTGDDRASIEKQVRQLHQRVGELNGIRDRYERELGLVGESVDLTEAQQELEKERVAQLERKYAAEIVGRALRRILQKILPATMDYMRRILPQLTRDRYHDAELDPDTFKIRVWDERAGSSGAWKEKNIFSGGTKDQFSLALRLAFALATLPQERGTSPGFIFLDEPLGSFDDDRANALLYLLTEGEIGRAFDQILLISHVPVQESKFPYHIRLESGAVAHTNLPGGDSPE